MPDERLWNRNFSLFFTARSTSVLGDMMLPVAITPAILDAGYRMTGVGYALAANTAPYATFVIFGGVLADRFGPRRMMVGSDAARLVLMSLLAAAFMAGTPALWQVLGLLALAGLGSATFQPGVASVTRQMSQDVQKVNAALQVSKSVVTVLGPAVAGLLLVVSSASVVIAVDALTFGISGGCLLMLRHLAPAEPESGASLREDLAQGWTEFSSRAWLWKTIVIFMLGSLVVFGPTETVGYATIVSRYGEGAFGLIMSLFGLGSMLSGMLAVRLRPAFPLRGAAVAVAGYIFAPLVVALGLPVPLVAAGYAIAGGGITYWMVMFHATVQTKVPVEALSRVHAYDVAGSLIMIPVGRVIAGPLGERYGSRPLLLGSAGLGIVVTLLLIAVSAIRDLRRSATPALSR